VDCVNCAVERLFGQAPVPPRPPRLIVKRGTLIIDFRDGPEIARKVEE
jgi:hypothetical protein